VKAKPLQHYVFRSVWEVDAPFDVVCDVLRDVATYPDWWPEIRTVDQIGHGRYEMVARSFLPYELRFVSEDRTSDDSGPKKAEAGIIDARLSGDLVGFARWTVTKTGGGCRLVYDQEVDTHKRLLNALAPIARPAFKLNHTFMMRHGQAGLRTYLAGLLAGVARGAR
jgi:Polyketide cyclase / dehydrase and lipid transport